MSGDPVRPPGTVLAGAREVRFGKAATCLLRSLRRRPRNLEGVRSASRQTCASSPTSMTPWRRIGATDVCACSIPSNCSYRPGRCPCRGVPRVAHRRSPDVRGMLTLYRHWYFWRGASHFAGFAGQPRSDSPSKSFSDRVGFAVERLDNDSLCLRGWEMVCRLLWTAAVTTDFRCPLRVQDSAFNVSSRQP